MEEIIVTNKNNLKAIISEVIEEKLIAFSHWFESKLINQDKILTRQETADYLGISLSTLYRWTQQGIIKAYGISDKTYYKMNDIHNAMKTIN